MKNIIILLSLLYCNTFDFIGSSDNHHNSFLSSLTFLNFISHTTAQSLNKEHQQAICSKLKAADYNGDKKIDSADYSLIYLVSMKDQITLENIGKNPDVVYLMDLSLKTLDRAPSSKKSIKISDINEQDVAVFYNYLTNNIPYCPYKNSI